MVGRPARRPPSPSLLATTGLVVLLAVGCWAGTASYEDENIRILEMLPVFPGATVVAQDTRPYSLNDADRPDGWGTVVLYSVPSSTTDYDIIEHYQRALSGWDVDIDTVPCGDGCQVLMAHFYMDDSMISVNTDNVPLDSTFELGIDARRCRIKSC